MFTDKPILITGLPRSGTTWVGRMIAQVPSVRYIHEPFNISNWQCACGIDFEYWFRYISQENEANFYQHFVHTFGPAFNRFNLLNVLIEMRATRRLRPLINYARSLKASRVLIKDPLAIFSTEWLATKFDMDVIVVIRHPAAIVSSYKRLNWSHSFSQFLAQPLLMKDHLHPFEAEIRDFADNFYDIVDQAALLWKLIYYQVEKYQENHKNWLFVNYEELAHNPIDSFQTIFEKLNLEYTERVSQALHIHSNSINPVNSSDPYSIKRDSKQTILDWKKSLTSREIERIRTRVEDVASLFYSDDDW